MARNPEIVRIPKPAANSFNKNRAAGHLLRTQTLHLRHALAQHSHKVTRHLARVAALLAIDINAIRTEGEVSEYAKHVTAILHPRKKKQAAK